MKNLKKSLSILILLSIVLAIFAGCENGTTDIPEDETPDTETIVQVYSVGEEIAGGFTVTVADELGGFIAAREVDTDDDGTADQFDKIVSGRFGTDMTWGDETDDYVYYLTDAVFIGNDNSDNCTLTIKAGTLIKGEVGTTKPGALIITRGSKIDAQGTAAAPIVFTSAASSRTEGDWGGIIINGNATVNEASELEGEGSTGLYGGTNDADNSGILKYVRVEFAGTQFSPDNELNGIAFQGVGSGTTVSYIQVHRNADDGVEFFGGTVNIDHIVITGAQDDSLDWTWGWTGTADHIILQQYASNHGSDSFGIEADNDSETPEATPVSAPTIKNMTLLSHGASGFTAAKFRRGTNATLVNCIIINSYADSTILESGAGTITYDGVISDTGSTTAPNWDAAVAATTPTAQENNGTIGITYSEDLEVTPTAVTTTLTLSSNGDDYWGAVPVNATGTDEWYKGWTSVPLN